MSWRRAIVASIISKVFEHIIAEGLRFIYGQTTINLVLIHVIQSGIISPQLFNIYIDALSDIFNKSSVGGSIGGKRINHMLYADDLCIVSFISVISKVRSSLF